MIRMVDDNPVAWECEGNKDCGNLTFLYKNDEGEVVRSCPLHVDIAFANHDEKRERDYTMLDNF